LIAKSNEFAPRLGNNRVVEVRLTADKAFKLGKEPATIQDAFTYISWFEKTDPDNITVSAELKTNFVEVIDTDGINNFNAFTETDALLVKPPALVTKTVN